MTWMTIYESPFQPLLLASDGQALTALYLASHRHGLAVPADWVHDDNAAPFAAAREQLAAYFDGRLREFDLPLAPRGTPFQQRVWEALRQIPYGQTLSYGELARRIGHPAGARAVGLANGRNPVSIIVPCHRVIGADGRLVGYGGGLDCKQALLEFEANVLAGQATLFSGCRRPVTLSGAQI